MTVLLSEQDFFSGLEEYRRLFDTNFNYTNERKAIKINNEEFTYELNHSSGNTYYVEHLPYNKKFPSLIYPNELQAAIDKRFSEIKYFFLYKNSKIYPDLGC
ncbi:Probable lipoprotein precursor (fragment) [Tenacibaculum maritimum]